MAPVTRRSQAQGIAKKAPTRKPRPARQTSREPSDSWDIIDEPNPTREITEHLDPAQPDSDDNDADSVSRALLPSNSRTLALAQPSQNRTSTALDTIGDDDTTGPLRAMAERIGKQVETFAEQLDQVLDVFQQQQQDQDQSRQAADAEPSSRFEAVLELIDDFHDVAAQAVLELKKSHERERAAQLREEWSRAAGELEVGDGDAGAADHGKSVTRGGSVGVEALSERKAEQVRALRGWQQEADLWDLFRLVLETHYRPDVENVRAAKREERKRWEPVHRYTPESELWERFMLEDDVAFERSAIRKWLEQTADHQESDVQGIVEELEKRAGRGKGLWSHGWMHTRERIKGEKRLRAWPNAEDSPLPQLSRSDNNELLVTTLDPDAASRQGRTLEKPDAYLERAIWIACWEMLRRGKPVNEVSRWCSDRKEGWRAASIGKGTHQADAISAASWRKACYLASQSETASDYEAAVFGLLGGNIRAMQKVCRTVDDHLFAHYSAALTTQFDGYLLSARPGLTPSHSHNNAEAPHDAEQELVNLILQLRRQPTTSSESVQPLKIIESYLLAHDIRSMIHTVGHAIAYADAQRNEGEQMILHLPQFWEGNTNVPEAEIGLDPQALRIVTHISIILRALYPDDLVDDTDAEENVIVAWIQALRAAGKRDLIPIYASRLQKSRYVAALSRVLPDVMQANEQEEMVRLLQQYHLDTVAILDAQVEFLLSSIIKPLPDGERPLRLLESTLDTKLYPGQRIILDGLPDELMQDDEIIVRSLKWYNVLRGHWKATFDALSMALRKCLVHGRIACALEIVHNFPYENVSLQKSYQVIGRSVNLMEFDAAPPEEEATTWALLAKQSRTYHELEVIVTAIKALAHWRECENLVTQAGPRSSSASVELRNAKDAVDEAMALVLTPGLLTRPEDADTTTATASPAQLADLADRTLIRATYIPELVLAYNSVLHSAGSILSRDALIQSMDLSVAVARDDSRLAECFVRAGRMRELVTSFAHSSKLMLLLKELGGPTGKKRKKPARGRADRDEGKDLGMWEIGPQGVVAAALAGPAVDGVAREAAEVR